MNNIAIRIIFLVATFAVISSCGIPTTQFLGPPDGDTVSWTVSPPTVTFSHNDAENSTENFLGYEIYYKFYQFLPDPMNGEFGSDYAALVGAAPGSGKTAVEARGFHRVFEAGDTVGDLPLVGIETPDPPIDPSTKFDVEIAFPYRPSALSPAPALAVLLDRNAPTGSDQLGSVQLVRDPLGGTGLSEKSFESDDISTAPPDLDIPLGIPQTDAVIHMAIVVLAYGIDYTGGNFETLYSDPLIIEEPLEIILQ